MCPRRDASIWLYSQHHFKNMTFRGPHLRAKTYEPLNQNEERVLREISRRCFSMQRYCFFRAQAISSIFTHRLTSFTNCCPFLLNLCMALEFIFDNELQVAILKLEWIRDKIWSCWPHIEDIKKIKMVPLSAHWISPREETCALSGRLGSILISITAPLNPWDAWDWEQHLIFLYNKILRKERQLKCSFVCEKLKYKTEMQPDRMGFTISLINNRN